MTRLKDIPQLQSDGRNLPAVMEAVREVIQTFRGYRGDKMDRALTLRDLDLATARSVIGGGTIGGGGGSTVVVPGGGGGGGGSEEPDLTPPPTPTGLVLTAGLTSIFVGCDVPSYTQGHGHDRTVVYGAKWPVDDPEPVFMDAVELWQFQGPASAYPTETGTRWCIWIKWRSMDGVPSTDPAGGTNGVQATTGKIGNADLGPLVVQAANLAAGAVDLGSNKVTGTITDPARFGALAVGYTVTQYLLATSGVMSNLIVDNSQIANLSAAKLTAGDGTIGGNLKSSNYVAGTSGWIVTPAGAAEFSDATVRGTVYATAGQIGGITIASNAVRAGQSAFNTGSGFYLGADGRFSLGSSSGNKLTWDGSELNVVGGGTFSGALSAATGTFVGNVSAGQFTTGAFVGAAWPAAGNYGTYLGPWGLMIGNANNNKYFQVTHEGNIYAPAFTVINGVMTVSQANVIDTLNIAGEAVTSTLAASGSASSISLGVNVPAGLTYRMLILGFQGTYSPVSGGGGSPVTLSCEGQTVNAAWIAYTYDVGPETTVTEWSTTPVSLAVLIEVSGATYKTITLSGIGSVQKTLIAMVLKR